MGPEDRGFLSTHYNRGVDECLIDQIMH